ncbi:hypothetical protein BLNAU_8295 [Blattamonas nauphoetae]|uniref:Uncharacterized protein n=1 Tax=Blattamonas nauphoetae TaxID=2049346 RepID=A0ABQ9XYW9_9EUKA|nr:hypothetical protein BLNAU_8295 [Blattamonas nauphoetae]
MHIRRKRRICVFGSLQGQRVTYFVFDQVTVEQIDSKDGGSFIDFGNVADGTKLSCEIKDCWIQRETASESCVINQQFGSLTIDLTTISDNNRNNCGMVNISSNTTIDLSNSKFSSSVNRLTSQKYRLFSGTIGNSSLRTCSAVIFSIDTPTCDGYVMLFVELPVEVRSLFETSTDQTKGNKFSPIISTKGEFFDFGGDPNTIIVDEEGLNIPECGTDANPCQSIDYVIIQHRSNTTQFSISVRGEFRTLVNSLNISCLCAGISRLRFMFTSTTTQNVFFRPSSSTTFSEVELNYDGDNQIVLIQLVPSRTQSSFQINFDKHETPVHNVILFSLSSLSGTIESSSISSLNLTGSSTLLSNHTRTKISKSSLSMIYASQPLLDIASDTILIIDQTTMATCQSTNADALIVVHTHATLSVTSSTFDRNSGNMAGVIFVEGMVSSDSLLIETSLFLENRALNNSLSALQQTNLPLFGNDITFSERDFQPSFKNSYSSSLFPRVVVGVDQTASSFDAFAGPSQWLYLSSLGHDTLKCGENRDPCQTLSFSIRITNETYSPSIWTDSTKTVVLRPYGHFREQSVPVLRKNISIEGRKQTELDLATDSDDIMFDVRDSLFCLKQVSIHVDSTEHGSCVHSVSSTLLFSDCIVSVIRAAVDISLSIEHQSTPIVNTTFGSIEIRKLRTETENDVIFPVCLFTISNSDATFSSSTVSNLASNSADGLISARLEDSTFDQDGVVFRDNTVESECPLLGLTILGNGVLNISQISFVRTSLSHSVIFFSETMNALISVHVDQNPNKTSDTPKPMHLFIDELSLSSSPSFNQPGSVLLISNPSRLPVHISSQTNGRKLSGIAWDSIAEKAGPPPNSLLPIVIPKLETYFVNADVEPIQLACGTNQHPCDSLTLPICLIHPEREDQFTIVLGSSVDVTITITDERCNSFVGNHHSLTVSSSLSTSPVFSITRQIQLAQLVLTLPSVAERTQPIIDCIGGEFTMKTVSIFQTSQSDSLNVDLISSHNSKIRSTSET